MHRGWLEPNGLITDHATLGRRIKAASASDAVSASLVRARRDTNLVWLPDDEDALVWSLRLDDENTVAGG